MQNFLLGDMVVFIPPGGSANKVGFPRSDHIFTYSRDGMYDYLIYHLIVPVSLESIPHVPVMANMCKSISMYLACNWTGYGD